MIHLASLTVTPISKHCFHLKINFEKCIRTDMFKIMIMTLSSLTVGWLCGSKCEFSSTEELLSRFSYPPDEMIMQFLKQTGKLDQIKPGLKAFLALEIELAKKICILKFSHSTYVKKTRLKLFIRPKGSLRGFYEFISILQDFELFFFACLSLYFMWIYKTFKAASGRIMSLKAFCKIFFVIFASIALYFTKMYRTYNILHLKFKFKS